ncbi:TIGR02452 family protein [Niastella yeongjuensis]|uniref:TIGR02452 family protein n=1 Tax=Niastella yeongjuensis TaxID=354355 RepID=A0A1V9ELU1_9BACT|nr:TIGR02452 family protein [Niastella yeongjuensis]OQP46914.1 TIGR02452 family protein [Niastella yeongjuensis]SEN60383.1 TIGR02452 family protein [Niastella yeongjuensis]
MKQSRRIEIANDTLGILEKGFYNNTQGEKVDISLIQKNAVDNTQLFKPEQLDELLNNTKKENSFQTQYEVTNETTCDAARRLVSEGMQDVMCLNFASAKNPGGGFLGGALAQEECIARASGLYPSLLTAMEYYNYHRKLGTCLYSDHMIYSPAIPIIKDEGGQVLDEPVCVTIVTSPAVNAGVVRRSEESNIEKIIPRMRMRVEKLLALCQNKQHTTLVLGAWGCGVFQNEPEEISELFREALTGKFANQFQRVVFAVKTNKESIIEPFEKRFK